MRTSTPDSGNPRPSPRSRAAILAGAAVVGLLAICPGGAVAQSAGLLSVSGQASLDAPAQVRVQGAPIDATNLQWQLCTPDGSCTPVDDGGDPMAQAVGDAPAGSVWKVTAQSPSSPGGLAAGISDAWNGPLEVTTPPAIPATVMPGQPLDISPGRWQGGFTGTGVRRLVVSCADPSPRDCHGIFDSHYGGQQPVIPRDADRGRFLRVVELPTCRCFSTLEMRFPPYPVTPEQVADGPNVSAWAQVARPDHRTDPPPHITIKITKAPRGKVHLADVSEALTLRLNAGRARLTIRCDARPSGPVADDTAATCQAPTRKLKPFRGQRITMTFTDAHGFVVRRKTGRYLR